MAEDANRDFVLLGIRYEAALVGGVNGDALESISEGIRAEAGDDWETNPLVLRGRNAVREEHGLPRIGEPPREPAPPPTRRGFLRRFFRR